MNASEVTIIPCINRHKNDAHPTHEWKIKEIALIEELRKLRSKLEIVFHKINWLRRSRWAGGTPVQTDASLSMVPPDGGVLASFR